MTAPAKGETALVLGGERDGDYWPVSYREHAYLEGYWLMRYPSRAVYVHRSLIRSEPLRSGGDVA